MEEKLLNELREIKKELQTIASSMEQSKKIELLIDNKPLKLDPQKLVRAISKDLHR